MQHSNQCGELKNLRKGYKTKQTKSQKDQSSSCGSNLGQHRESDCWRGPQVVNGQKLQGKLLSEVLFRTSQSEIYKKIIN